MPLSWPDSTLAQSRASTSRSRKPWSRYERIVKPVAVACCLSYSDRYEMAVLQVVGSYGISLSQIHFLDITSNVSQPATSIHFTIMFLYCSTVHLPGFAWGLWPPSQETLSPILLDPIFRSLSPHRDGRTQKMCWVYPSDSMLTAFKTFKSESSQPQRHLASQSIKLSSNQNIVRHSQQSLFNVYSILWPSSFLQGTKRHEIYHMNSAWPLQPVLTDEGHCQELPRLCTEAGCELQAAASPEAWNLRLCKSADVGKTMGKVWKTYTLAPVKPTIPMNSLRSIQGLMVFWLNCIAHKKKKKDMI